MTFEPLSDLLATGEGARTEFKRAMPSDLGREICAFANATGGVILLGVSDAGEVVGIGGHNRLNLEPSRHQVVVLRNSLSSKPWTDFMRTVGRTDRTKFRNQVLRPLLDEGWLEMTVPDKPNHHQPKHRLTDRGRALLAAIEADGGRPRNP